MKNKEIWKDIEGYEGDYQVSNFGRVKSLKFGKELILKPVITTKKYLQVNLCKNKIRKVYHIHRLVAQAFISNPNSLPQVNHKDENPSNNSVENLEWCDCKYNINFGTHNQRSAEKRSKPVLQYTKSGDFIKEWKSLTEVHTNLGFNIACISYCCLGKYKYAYGFIWKYKD